MFIDGIRSDQTEAAIITPAAKPSRDFSVLGDILSFNRNTIAEPREVPTKGMNSVIKVVIISSDASKSDKSFTNPTLYHRCGTKTIKFVYKKVQAKNFCDLHIF